jgi:recombination protein RecA
VQKSGSWFSYDGTKLGQGRDTVKSLLEDNPELLADIESKILNKTKAGEEVLEIQPEAPAE